MTLPFSRAMQLAALCCVLAAHQPLLAAEPTVATLIQESKSGSEAARIKAIDELGSLGEKAAEAVPTLTQILSDSSANIRAHAANSLGLVGNSAKPAAGGLAALMKDNDETVRRQAIKALTAIRPGP